MLAKKLLVLLIIVLLTSTYVMGTESGTEISRSVGDDLVRYKVTNTSVDSLSKSGFKMLNGGSNSFVIYIESDSAGANAWMITDSGSVYLNVPTDKGYGWYINGVKVMELNDTTLVFEGTTDNEYQLILAITDPTTGDKTQKFQDCSGIVVLDTTACSNLEGKNLLITDGELNIINDVVFASVFASSMVCETNMTIYDTLNLDEIVATSGITCATLSTGQGQYELYAMNQDVESTDSVTFVTVNTGQGANELYDMNQDVQTTDDVVFADVSANTMFVDGSMTIVDTLNLDEIVATSGITAEHLKSTDDIEVADDIFMSDGGVIGITGNEYIRFDGINNQIEILGANVGIGTTLPDNKLDVEGGVVIGAAYSGTHTAPSDGLLVVGNVGIGTTEPGLKLAVYGASGYPASTGTTQTGIARFESSYNNVLDIGQASAFPYGVWLQATNRTALGTEYPLLLNPNGGNVGIGTTNPGAKLDVASNILISATSGYSTLSFTAIPFSARHAKITKNYDSPYNWDFYNSGNTTQGSINFYTDNGTAGSRLTINNTGNVGIGDATPSTILDVVAGSATDPVADAWDVHCGRADQQIVAGNITSKLDVIKNLPTYRWKKIAKLTKSKEASIDSTKKQANRDSLLAVKRALPKFTTERIGIMMDDPEVPAEILTFDKDGNKTGISLVGWIGYLTEALKEAGQKIDELEARIEVLEKKR